MYDFANTIFSYAVITAYFNDWIIQDRGNPDWYLSAMTVGSTILLVLTMPMFGAIADRSRRKPFLIGFTLLCVTATVLLGYVTSDVAALIVAGIAIFGFQSALAHYDPLLADVAPPERRGSVSGLGVGLGYVGVLVALIVLDMFVGEGDKQRAFLPTAAMYLFFSMPLFLFVRERRRSDQTDGATTRQVIAQASRQLARTMRRLPDYQAVARLLVARFLYVDALAVVITFMVIYMDRLGGFDETGKKQVLGLSIAFAAMGALVAGRLVERVGPRRVLLTVLTTFSLSMIGSAASGVPELMWFLGPVVGISLGAVWTADRVFMMRLTPPQERGEFFAVYNLVGKISNAAGPVIWGATIYLANDLGSYSLRDASRMAMIALALTAVAGMLILRPLSDTEHTYDEPALTAA